MRVRIYPSPPTLRSLTLTSRLSATPNKRVCGSLRSPKPLRASHTSIPLGETVALRQELKQEDE